MSRQTRKLHMSQVNTNNISTYVVQRVQKLPADIDHLVESSRREGYSFVDRLYVEWIDGLNRFALKGEALFVAQFQNRSVGICGLNRDPYLSDACVGRIRRLYVLSEYRRQSVGRLLIEACLAVAVGHFSSVRLRTFNPDADQFYVSLGFNRTEQDAATHVMEAPFEIGAA